MKRDSICIALDNVTNGLVVYPEVIRSHLNQELPFLATETIMYVHSPKPLPSEIHGGSRTKPPLFTI